MAYVTKELKAKAVANLKAALKDVNIKYSVSVSNHSALVCKISKSDIDFINNYNDKCRADRRTNSWGELNLCNNDYLPVNEHYIDRHFDGKSLDVLSKIKSALRTDEYYNNSDAMSDYFDQSHYIEITIGTWDKPFTLIKE